RSSTFRHTPPYHPYTLSLHDALPIYPAAGRIAVNRCEDQLEKAPSLEVEKISKRDSYSAISAPCPPAKTGLYLPMTQPCHVWSRDRKSTRLNSSHVKISYAVFCLKKK